MEINAYNLGKKFSSKFYDPVASNQGETIIRRIRYVNRIYDIGEFWLFNYHIHSLIGIVERERNSPVSESVYSFRVRAISDRDGLIGLFES